MAIKMPARGGLYSALEEDRETDLYKNVLQNLKEDYKHLIKYVDLSNMEDMALLKVQQEKVKIHQAHYLKKYQREQLCNPNIILLATDGKAPILKADCVKIFTHYRDISPEIRDAELRILDNKIATLREKFEQTKDLVIDLHTEGAYRHKTPKELKEFNARQKNALALLELYQKDLDHAEGIYYAIKYVDEVWEYINTIPDAETKYWGGLLSREIRVQRAIDAKIRLLAGAEKQMRALLKALYSFSENVDRHDHHSFTETQKTEIIEALSKFSDRALPPYRKKSA